MLPRGVFVTSAGVVSTPLACASCRQGFTALPLSNNNIYAYMGAQTVNPGQQRTSYSSLTCTLTGA